MTVLDSRGILHPNRDDLTPVKVDLAQRTNPDGLSGGMVEALKGADVFLGLSGGVVPEELIATMAPDGIVFALSNPDPEIHPEIAAKHAAVVATGRSDFLNQINNVLAFPGVFRGALDAGARRITEKMKVAAAEAIFGVVGDDLAAEYIVPSPLDPRVGPAVAAGGRGGVERRGRLTVPMGARRLVVALIALLFVAACGATTDEPSIAVGAARRRGVDAAGTPVRVCAAVLRHRRARRVVPDPLTGLDSGDVESRRVSPVGCWTRSCPARRRVPRFRSTARWCRHCPKALPRATTPSRRRTSRRSRSPRPPSMRGADGT